MDYKEANMAARYEHEIPKGYEARIDGNKVIIELKESEDERIRKELIEAIERARVFDIDKEVADRWISYLEKQKEPIPIPDKFSGLKSLMLQYLQSAANRKDDAEIESDTDLWGRKILDYIWKFDDKPAEWSEEDVEVLETTIATIEKNIKKGSQITTRATPSGIINREDLIKKLKSLRPQPVQLKESYKEGFQTARHAMALAFMKYCDKIRPNRKMCLSNGECEDIENSFLVGDWEKIERYFHKYFWKPSEEQMKALNKVIHEVSMSLKLKDKLIHLEDELKKL